MPETPFSYYLNAEMSIHTDGTLCQKILLSECWEISIPIKKYYAGEKKLLTEYYDTSIQTHYFVA